jgi:hypothetical protein
MSDKEKTTNWTVIVPIVVALIGVVGSVIAAVISNWDKIAAPTQQSDIVLVAPQSTACSPTDQVTRPRRPGQECIKFQQPKVKVASREIPLDGCLVWSGQCNQPLWEWFCREMKYSESQGAEVVVKDETYVLSSKRYCERSANQVCGGPEYITCLR